VTVDIRIRRARPEEFPAVAELDGASFGFHYSEQELADAVLDIDPARIMLATEGEWAPPDERGRSGSGSLAAVSAEVPLQMAVPGGDLRVMGITWVSVEITHRRRGVLRALVEHQLRAHAGAGCTATVLGASEGGIYGRFGFGAASSVRRMSIDRMRSRLVAPVDTGAVRRLSTDGARNLLPGLHERWRATTPGALGRDERRWQFLMLDREYQRHGASGLFHLVHPDGYVSYRIKPDWGDGDPRHECQLVDYAPVTPQAHAALWQTLLGMDLVGTITSNAVPPDDPLPHLLADPRRVETLHLGDGMWVRPLDVCALLGGRSYALEVEVALQVADPLLGDGRYLLTGGPDGATCTRTERAADILLGVGALGAICLGGTRLATLARAGVVSGAGDALRRLDLALLADRLPFHGTNI
jgi:predicted acetyltransferase